MSIYTDSNHHHKHSHSDSNTPIESAPDKLNEINVSTSLDDDNNLDSQDRGCNKCNSCGPCDLCQTIIADPSDISRHGGRLLTVRVKVTNVCVNKKVSVACIIYGNNGEILVFKAFTTIIVKDDPRIKCGCIERTLKFVLPDTDTFDPDNLNVRVIANYIYPCA